MQAMVAAVKTTRTTPNGPSLHDGLVGTPHSGTFNSLLPPGFRGGLPGNARLGRAGRAPTLAPNCDGHAR